MQSMNTANSEATIWARVIAPDQDGLSPEAARSLLELRFSEADNQRMDELAEKNKEGTITPDEREELDAYVKVGDVLSLIHLKVRKKLNR